jgi:hypothetical protein
MAAKRGKATPSKARMAKPRSMPSTAGAQPRGSHSYADSTFPRTQKLAAPQSGPMIKPSKQGSFTAKAKAAGKTPQAYAAQVTANPKNFDTQTIQQANFAKNFGGASKARARKGGSK